MYDQPRFDGLEPTGFFADSSSARPLVEGTVARGWGRQRDAHFFLGVSGDSLARTFPYRITRPVLERGRREYEVFCTPCHGKVGYGEGIVPARGFARSPPSFHSDRLREAPVGHLYQVIREGQGLMYGYGDRIAPADRWAIVAYLRALQRSQNPGAGDAPNRMNGASNAPNDGASATPVDTTRED